MQGFKQSGDDYIIKELAILPLNIQSDPVVMLFEKPFSWQRLTDKYKRENAWLERHYHGINWNKGTIPYNQIGSLLRDSFRDATRVLTIGSIKKKWLERFKFKFEIRDVAEMGFPPLDKIKLVSVCPHHNGAYRACCALHNVRLLKKYFKDSNAIPLVDEYMECN